MSESLVPPEVLDEAAKALQTASWSPGEHANRARVLAVAPAIFEAGQAAERARTKDLVDAVRVWAYGHCFIPDPECPDIECAAPTSDVDHDLIFALDTIDQGEASDG